MNAGNRSDNPAFGEQQFRAESPDVYEKAINHTSRANAPWFIIPTDRKWYMPARVIEIILLRMNGLVL